MPSNFMISFLLVLCISCNDKIKISGIVVDQSSNKPIDSVVVTCLDEVKLKEYDQFSTFTSTEGRFALIYSFREQKEKSRLPFIFQKEGYGSVTEFFPKETGNDTIFLKRLVGQSQFTPSTGSVKYLIPDFFEIDSVRLQRFKSGGTSNWFVTKDGKSRLYLVPYTDYTITTAILTVNDKLPKDLTDLLASEGIKYHDVANAIQLKDLISRRGFKSGITRQFAIDIYGAPKSKIKEGEFETLKWSFKIKEGIEYNEHFLTPYILDGLAFDVELSFKNDLLHTLIYRYEVP